MSNIVKSFAVVDDRPPGQIEKNFSDVVEARLKKAPVLKKQMFTYQPDLYAAQIRGLPDKQGHIDELNRIKLEIAQAKAELKSLGLKMEEAAGNRMTVPAEAETERPGGGDTAAAKAEAEKLLDETKTGIDNMMNKARLEGERLSEEAKTKGYLEGFDQGFNQAASEFRAENEPKILELEALLESLSEYRDEMIAQNEKELVSLVLAVARRIIGREIAADPRAVAGMLYEELDKNRREEDIRITVSQDLMPAEGRGSAEIKKLIAATAPNALIYVDEDAEEGTCTVETNKGITDLSLDTQIRNAGRLLTEE